jgi:hypothetical protein
MATVQQNILLSYAPENGVQTPYHPQRKRFKMHSHQLHDRNLNQITQQ